MQLYEKQESVQGFERSEDEQNKRTDNSWWKTERLRRRQFVSTSTSTENRPSIVKMNFQQDKTFITTQSEPIIIILPSHRRRSPVQLAVPRLILDHLIRWLTLERIREGFHLGHQRVQSLVPIVVDCARESRFHSSLKLVEPSQKSV